MTDKQDAEASENIPLPASDENDAALVDDLLSDVSEAPSPPVSTPAAPSVAHVGTPGAFRLITRTRTIPALSMTYINGIQLLAADAKRKELHLSAHGPSATEAVAFAASLTDVQVSSARAILAVGQKITLTDYTGPLYVAAIAGASADVLLSLTVITE